MTLAGASDNVQGGPRWGGEAALSGWSSNRALNDQRGLLAARATLTLDWTPTSDWRLRGDAWALSASDRSPDGRRASADLREAFATWRGPCAPTLGKKVIAWGRTDPINPSDQLTPSDYRRLVPKESEQRKGVWGLHLNCAVGAGSLQAHLVDPRDFHGVPFPSDLGLSLLDERPRVRPTAALKYERLGAGLDWSVSAIDGNDLYPTLTLRSLDASGARLGQTATPMQLLGADAALTLGANVWRAEAAWVRYDNSGDPTVARRRPWAAAALQVEWSFGERETLALQGFVKHLRGAGSSLNAAQDQPASVQAVMASVQQAQGLLANEVDDTQSGLTLRYARPLGSEYTDGELLLVWAQPRDDGLLRLRVVHSISDRMRLSLGMDAFFGPRDSYLGNLRRNSLAFAEISHVW